MANLETLLPVTLPSRPSCNDCLSWSTEDIAVAGGESVHILTPKNQSLQTEIAGHPQWSIYSLRANIFRYDEWPEQTLDTLRDFSIGEEQSNSLVTTVAWSSAGLGIHKRPVLGVLTSNLVLSLWETDGTQANYKRTSIVNKFLAQETQSTTEVKDRRSLRIRSFTWAHALKTGTVSKWGLHYLVVADDHGNIMFLRIEKEKNDRFGGWKFTIDLKTSLQDVEAVKQDVSLMSPLQRHLYEQTPVSKIEIRPWQDIKHARTRNAINGIGSISSQAGFAAQLTIERGTALHNTIFYAFANGGRHVTLHHYKRLSGGNHIDYAEWEFMNTSKAKMEKNIRAKPEVYFKEVAAPLYDDFNTTFRLADHVRIRYWGSDVSNDFTQAVACMSLHPSDMVEYTPPSAEKCTLVFRLTGEAVESVLSSSETKSSSQEKILQFAAEALQHRDLIKSQLDQKLVQVYNSLASLVLESGSKSRVVLEQSERNLHDQLTTKLTGSEPVSSQSQSSRPSHDDPENCDICGSYISFTTDTTVADCRNGHHFSRCQLSFLAVQEPGISKFCSQCGKQFLDLTKLDPNAGPSFAQTVFNHFDECPYCQAKFRG